MAGGKNRAKLKKVLSPPTQSPPPIEGSADDQGELLDDLFAELDSRDPSVQQEAAQVISEIRTNSPVVSPSPSDSKKGSKQKFKEREVSQSFIAARHVSFRIHLLIDAHSPFIQERKLQAQLAAAPASDPEADARIERETQQEKESISNTCSSLNLEMVEVCHHISIFHIRLFQLY